MDIIPHENNKIIFFVDLYAKIIYVVNLIYLYIFFTLIYSVLILG